MIAALRRFACGWLRALFFLRQKKEVEKERVSKLITFLRRFARGWPFTVENEVIPKEGFKIDRMAQHWAFGVVGKILWIGLTWTCISVV